MQMTREQAEQYEEFFFDWLELFTNFFFAPTESMNITYNAQQAVVHWRSLVTGATGHGAQMPVGLARAAADLGNRTHKHFHHWIVESPNESPQSGQFNT